MNSSQIAVQSIESLINIINDYSNETFLYENQNITSTNSTNIKIYHFIEAAKVLLHNSTGNNSYAVLTFKIDSSGKSNKLRGNSLSNELITHISSTLRTHIKEPNLYCNINENFVILLENYKSIDIAILVIQLSEEISCFCRDLKTKLSFGICMADQTNQEICSILKRALYALSPLKRQENQLLACCTELSSD